MRKILITGKTGYIASSLYHKLKDEYDVTTLGRSDIDLSDTNAVNEWFKDKHFDVVLHTAVVGGHRLYKDDDSVVQTNIKMYTNLLDNKDKYDKFINIGSGAEIYQQNTPYGISKSIIRFSLLQQKNFYNIRAYAVFDENELETRFIKSNIIRYINKEQMILHQDKRMDFFYMNDFILLIKYYIESDFLLQEVNCSYDTVSYLSDILSYINTLSDYTVPIMRVNNTSSALDYTGVFIDFGLPYIGLTQGIKNVYRELSCKK